MDAPTGIRQARVRARARLKCAVPSHASRGWGGIIFGVCLDPTSQGSLLRRLSCRSPANYSEALVTYRSSIGVSPKQKVEPSSANALGLDFGFHPEILESERDRMIALSTVK